MPAIKLPGTERVIFLPEHSGDHEIDLGNYPEIDNAIKQEDVVVTGNWQDYSGSGTVHPQAVTNQGIENELQFDLQAAVDKQRFSPVNVRGVTASTHRSRNKIITLEVKNE